MSDEREIDELFADPVEVEPSMAASPRLPQVIVALVALGILIAIAVVIVVSGLSAVKGGSANAVCGSAAACSNLSLDQVRSLTAINLPDGSVVLDSSYEETDDQITVTARVALADGSDDPFAGTGYGTIATPALDWPVDDLAVLAYYGASGEQGTLNAEAVYAIDDQVRQIVLVQVARVPE